MREFYREFSVIASAATKVFVPRAQRSALLAMRSIVQFSVVRC
jgi:hypothetical protein